MSDRERWIVYPLLFMALGFGLRNGVEIQGAQEVKTLEIQSVHCRELRVVNASGKTIAQIGANSGNEAGILEVANAKGSPQVILSANSISGALTILDGVGRPILQVPTFEQRMKPAGESGQEAKSENAKSPGESTEKGN
jgi:hypothetical protein